MSRRTDGPIYCLVADGAGWAPDIGDEVDVRVGREILIKSSSGFGPTIAISPDVVIDLRLESKRGGWGHEGAVKDAVLYGGVAATMNRLSWNTRITVETNDGFVTLRIEEPEDKIRSILRSFRDAMVRA